MLNLAVEALFVIGGMFLEISGPTSSKWDDQSEKKILKPNKLIDIDSKWDWDK